MQVYIVKEARMPKGEVRERMVRGAVRLLARNGPPGASIGDVLALTGAPRGSTYHHFPGGRAELYRAALDEASTRATAYLEPVRGRSADAVVKRFFVMWRELLLASDLSAGCAVLAVAVAGEDAEAVEHSGVVFAQWRDHLAALLHEGGLTRARSRALAATVIAAAEGAVVVARAEGDLAAFDLVTREMVRLSRA
jgi:AcrR family transcriptional regulator